MPEADARQRLLQENGLELGEVLRGACGNRRGYANRLIDHLEEFGANYFRLSEVIPISADTYRSIAGAVSEEGLEVDGQKIPLTRQNRKKVMASVGKIRERALPKTTADNIRRRLDAVVADLKTDAAYRVGAADVDWGAG